MSAPDDSAAMQTNVMEDTPLPTRASRDYSGIFNGVTVRYRAEASEIYIRDEKGSPRASFFTVAYSKVDGEERRPVMFIFNGGPGSSTQWLHMGAFGPRRVAISSEPEGARAPPYRLVDNEESSLDTCDLVFVDPVGTGYSCALGTATSKDFWGLLEDAQSIADFIQVWISDRGRWNSPKYLVGESYGTTRAALVADILSSRFVALNGIVLISAVLDYQNSRPRTGDGGILSYASFVPTYAATAWYHGRIDRGGRSLETLLHDARTFASTTYAQALIANSRLPRSERRRVVADLAKFTGLDPSYVEQCNLRVPVNRYLKQLLRDQHLVVGRLDGRYTGTDSDAAGETPESDPTLDAIGSSFTSAIHAQLSELGVRIQRAYQPMKTIEEWNWLLQGPTPNGGGYINVVPYLGRAMRRNQDLRVFVASGYYDLATPFFGAENALSQDGLVHERIAFAYYEVGHMIFLHEPSRTKLMHDVRDFTSTLRVAHGS